MKKSNYNPQLRSLKEQQSRLEILFKSLRINIEKLEINAENHYCST
jgi:hypothetical protein